MNEIAKLEKLGQEHVRNSAKSALLEIERYVLNVLQEKKCFVTLKTVDPIMRTSNEWIPCKLEKVKFHPHYEILNVNRSGGFEFIISVKEAFTGKEKVFSVKKESLKFE